MCCRGKRIAAVWRIRPERRVRRRRHRLNGDGVGSQWSSGGELEVESEMKKMKWGKRGELPPAPLFIP
jgi:hypothetical protein